MCILLYCFGSRVERMRLYSAVQEMETVCLLAVFSDKPGPRSSFHITALGAQQPNDGFPRTSPTSAYYFVAYTILHVSVWSN